MDLKEWTINHVKHKDIIKKNLKGYEEKEDSIEFEFKDGKKTYVLSEKLSEADIENDCMVVCLNTEENLEFLVENWKDYVETNIGFIFANPSENDKWIIRPAVHAKIADPDTLEEGLRAMFEQVTSL